MLERDEIDALFPRVPAGPASADRPDGDLPGPEYWEQRYPPRDLPAGAMVTRFSPSPTGAAHLGGVYVAMLDKDLARHSGGAYFIRVEDTDQARTVEGALLQFDAAFTYFGVHADETPEKGAYGPYTQSERAEIYLSYAREFLRDGRAYLCFATKEELAASAEQQRAAKVPTGYYARWALWRDAPDEQVREALAAGRPYVVRFRSPGGSRVTYTDLIRGEITADANRNDVVLLKSSDSPLRLPTYHFAHAVDDHLMRVTHVIRADEWLSSVPLHLQLFDAAGFERIPYAHIAPLLKGDGSSKRKLSKRKDPEASVEFYIAAGYPADAVLYYLRGLINGRLAVLPMDQALAEPLRLSEAGVSGALVDLVKLEDIAADHIATLSGQTIVDEVLGWADVHDTELASAVRAEPRVALRALDIERTGVENPRKDLRKWSDFRSVYGYFFAALFEPVTDPADPRLGALPADVVRALCEDFLRDYRHVDDSDEWFGQIRAAAVANRFAGSPKEYKADKDSFVGSTKEAAQVFRVLLTGSNRSPAFHLVTQALGEPETRRRLGAVLAG
ncbi:glutamate--tRNA ligase [Frankia sp. AgB1.9]|uniref:glutamate--tRNA ligase n=1 Tax=unclassified Frankia TaxID=2632575 RepID=UPI0019348B92|nr:MULTISPECIES: glutamate--tRNA ligase family protein [unclassified Frankia]MBL7493415.1 glutamate--tRNA ligase [Frankia sp. AgW1.1]MBL7549066.1 glutamate--tRNA ligase [Frankia sp. AgB1.9]MBL7624289.1 glutamate--tRNA ligase [Frankia sp. AgB1.8]